FPSTPPEGGEVRQAFLSAMQVRGPLKVQGEQQSASRQRIFSCHPDAAGATSALNASNESNASAASTASSAEEAACARQIIGTLAQRAFRRPVSAAQLQPLLAFYESGRKTGGFETGVRDALTA